MFHGADSGRFDRCLGQHATEMRPKQDGAGEVGGGGPALRLSPRFTGLYQLAASEARLVAHGCQLLHQALSLVALDCQYSPFARATGAAVLLQRLQ